MDYQGGNYYFQALSGLGQDFQKAIERHKELEKQKEFADDTIGYMARNPKMAEYLMNEKDSVPQDALNRYHAASVSQKTSMATAALANMNMDMKRQEMEQKQEDMKAQAEERKATAAWRTHLAQQDQPENYNYIPSPDGKQYIGLQGSRGTMHMFRQPYDIPGQVDPVQQTAPQQGMMSRFGNWFGGQAKQIQADPQAAANLSGNPGDPRQMQAPQAPQIPKGNGRKLDPQTAQMILQQAGGDKMAARQLALQLGYTL